MTGALHHKRWRAEYRIDKGIGIGMNGHLIGKVRTVLRQQTIN